MSRITIPANINAAPKESQPLLEVINKKFGQVPNLFRLVSNAPSALQGYLALSEALSKGKITDVTGKRIALAVSEINGCDYCLSAHTYLGLNAFKLTQNEIDANRDGSSLDPKAAAAVQFAASIAKDKGRLSSDSIEEIKQAGYSEEEIVEIVLHVALNTFTNFLNELAQTEIDFPEVKSNY